jgi:hypothetical protein
VSVPGRAEDKKADKSDSIALFNGKNLDGWKIFMDPRAKNDDKLKDIKPEDVWSVKDETIVCTGKPFGYLITEKEFENYVLEVEWMWPGKGFNSGVFVHVTGPDKIWPKAVEAQLWHTHAGDFWLVDNFKLDVDKSLQDPKAARHFYRMNKDTEVEKPLGQWNKYVITCKGDTIKLEVNGKLVNEGKNAENSKGKILLQSEGGEIHFRNIKLTPIK